MAGAMMTTERMNIKFGKDSSGVIARVPPVGLCRHAFKQSRSHRGSRLAPIKQPSYREVGQVVCAQLTDKKYGETSKASSGGLLSVFCPLLRLVSSGDAAATRPRWLEVTTSGLSSIARLPFGTNAGDYARNRLEQPALPLQLYEFEACPFCRRVREAITDLDLVVDVFPCPKDSTHHRAAVEASGGKLQFPFLVDPNTGEQLYESDAIVKYLYDKYGGGATPPFGLLESTLFTGWMPTLVRAGRGMVRYEKAAEEVPAERLRLYNYENNQFARLVREALCELELPYTCISAGKGSPNRNELRDESGRTTVPYLVDPNTGAAMGESAEIVKYLFTTYGAAAS